MKRSKILITLLLVLTAVGCRHDEGDMVLELRSESLGGHKMAVENQTAEWSAGDSVWVNGECYAINFSNGQAKILVPHSATYNAVFPASIMTGNNQVTLPSEYHYATDASGRQLLNLPMVATSTGNSLFFYHLTGALIVKYVNHRSETFTLDRVTVSSNDFAICGTRAITFGDTAQTPSDTGGRSVTVWFDRQVTTLASGDTLAVMVPVAPVGATNLFTVEVSSHVAGNRYTVSNTQDTAYAFPRNGLGYAYMVESGSSATALFQETEFESVKTMHISTASDFLLMQKSINNGWTLNGFRYSTFSYSIDADIDMSGIEIAPIHGFTGPSFNGNGNTISNLTIRSNTSSCALFDTIISATISNISLTNVTLISEGSIATRYISPLIGRISSNTLNNCTTDVARITTNTANIVYGGLVATNGGTLNINNCVTTTRCDINSANTLSYGGIIGEAGGNVTCTTCTVNNLNIHLHSNNRVYAGGVIGYGKTGTINTLSGITCIDTLNIQNSSGNFYVGGVIGYIYKASQTFFYLYNNSQIRGIISGSTSGASNLYFGKVYGFGYSKGTYNYNKWSYSATGLTIPANGGNIISGDPSGLN